MAVNIAPTKGNIIEVFSHEPFNYTYLCKIYSHLIDRYFVKKLPSVLVVINPMLSFQELLKSNPPTIIIINQTERRNLFKRLVGNILK